MLLLLSVRLLVVDHVIIPAVSRGIAAAAVGILYPADEVGRGVFGFVENTVDHIPAEIRSVQAETEPQNKHQDQYTHGRPEGDDQKQDRKPDRQFQKDLAALFADDEFVVSEDPFDFGKDTAQDLPCGSGFSGGSGGTARRIRALLTLLLFL